MSSSRGTTRSLAAAVLLSITPSAIGAHLILRYEVKPTPTVNDLRGLHLTGVLPPRWPTFALVTDRKSLFAGPTAAHG